MSRYEDAGSGGCARLLWTALSLVTLLAAVLVGVGKLLMPYSAHYQPQLEAWLSKEFNQPVKVDAFTGEWKAFGPRISLEGLNLLGAPGQAQAIAIRQAALDIKPLNALIAGRPLYSFRIIGADLELVLDRMVIWSCPGLASPGAAMTRRLVHRATPASATWPGWVKCGWSSRVCIISINSAISSCS